jgi:hypothetical protein
MDEITEAMTAITTISVYGFQRTRRLAKVKLLCIVRKLDMGVG